MESRFFHCTSRWLSCSAANNPTTMYIVFSQLFVVACINSVVRVFTECIFYGMGSEGGKPRDWFFCDPRGCLLRLKRNWVTSYVNTSLGGYSFGFFLSVLLYHILAP